jgi:outer membrane protein
VTRSFLIGVLALFLSEMAVAQVPDNSQQTHDLPTAPYPQSAQAPILFELRNSHITMIAGHLGDAQSEGESSLDTQTTSTGQTSAGPLHLTRSQAEQLAVKNNPRISVAHLLALAQHQVLRESKAAQLPTFTGAMTAVEAHEGGRIGAGSLTASRLLDHAGAGVSLNQLITDFGRTTNLVASSKLLEEAQNANALATSEDIVLATDQAFYNVLQAQALVKVAQQTVNTRQSVKNQVSELAKSNLRSTLDLSFAEVNLSQAELLQLDAENNVSSALAALNAVLGFEQQQNYELTDDSPQSLSPPPNVDALIGTALNQRPDLQALTYDELAAEKFRRAQRDQLFPTISTLGEVGGTPVRPDCVGGKCFPNYFISSWYGAVGVNVSIPIFDGFLFTAQASEAKYRAKAAAESARDLRDRIVRDVRTAWLSANTAFQRITVAEELAKQADLSLNLAQDRYRLGLGSIVELSQAQLQQTDAAIGYVDSRYQYQLSLSTLNYETGTQP